MPNRMLLLAALAVIGNLDAPTVSTAQDEPGQVIPHAQDRPPNPPKTVEEALAAMSVPEGFTVEVVASEPNLVNPVSMTIDERGRFWVTESLEYPRREPGPGRDRIKVLEDTDGDGQADKFTIFAEGLNIPSGIAVGHGGVWVANAPDILFYPDADGDLKPDGPPEVVVTGFGRDDTHELPNSLTWGPDGALYGWNGVFNYCKVSSGGKDYEFSCAIFRIDPRTRAFSLFCEGTSNPWGIAINEDGELFASACVIDHLWHLVETGSYLRQGGPYPPFTWPMDSIVDHKHQKAAYCGIHYFDSDAYPEAFRGRLYMGNIHGNCINVDVLKKDGATYKGEAAPDFLSANDAWFMPVVQKTGPDGCLYILDWYDQYHCYQDANRDPAGVDRLKGRLYRVRYKGTPRRVGFNLAEKSDDELIDLLGSANVYDRDIAQRLLSERGTAILGRRLEELALDTSKPRTQRMHALWARIGGGEPDREFLATLMEDPDANLRAWAVRMLLRTETTDARLGELIARASIDPAPEVRLQVAIGAARGDRPKELFGEPSWLILRSLGKGPVDRLVRHVAWQNLIPRLGDPRHVESFLALIGKPGPTVALPVGPQTSPTLATMMPRVVDRLVGAEGVGGGAIARAASAALEMGEVGPSKQTLDGLTDAVRQGRLGGDRLAAVREALEPLVRQALDNDAEARPIRDDLVELAAAWGDGEALGITRAILADPKAADGERIDALRTLVSARDPEVLASVARLLDNAHGSAGFRGAVLESLGPVDDPAVAGIVLAAYPKMEPELKPRAVELLTQRPAWSLALVAAVEAQTVPSASVNVNQLRRLQASRNPEVAERAKAIWGTVREGYNEKRSLVVGQMQNFLAKTPGDPFAGQKVFEKLCAQCHKIYGEGQEVGPDITLNGRNDFQQLIANVFDPSQVIGAGFQATTVATVDGRILTGLLVEDSPRQVVLKIQGGKEETIARAEIEELKTSDDSLMPEDMESQLSPQELADLFSYLALDRPPTDPSAKRLPGAPAVKVKPAGGAGGE